MEQYRSASVLHNDLQSMNIYEYVNPEKEGGYT